jgi:hypothetical protein
MAVARSLKKRDHLQDFCRDMENNITIDREGAECIDLAQNRDRWQAVGKAIASLRLA